MMFLLLGPQMAVDRAFELVKTLVGGQWEGQAAPGVKVRFRYTLEQKGTVVIGLGSIDDGKRVIPVRATLGWDPKAKKVYYLDQHGSDVVYFGHVSLEGQKLVYDFKGMSGDTGHYRIESVLEKDASVATMSVESAGKWSDLGLRVAMKRRR